MEQLRHTAVGPECSQRLLRQIDRIRQLLPLDLAANLLHSLLHFTLNPFALLLFLALLVGLRGQNLERLLFGKLLQRAPRNFPSFPEALRLKQSSDLFFALLLVSL